MKPPAQYKSCQTFRLRHVYSACFGCAGEVFSSLFKSLQKLQMREAILATHESTEWERFTALKVAQNTLLILV